MIRKCDNQSLVYMPCSNSLSRRCYRVGVAPEPRFREPLERQNYSGGSAIEAVFPLVDM